MNKVIFYDTRKVKAENLSELQENINRSLEITCSTRFGIIKKGLNFSFAGEEDTFDDDDGRTIRVREIKCSPGFGFSPSGKFMKLERGLKVDIFPSLEEDDDFVYYLYLEYKRENGKESVELKSTVDFILEENELPSVFLDKDILILGFVENGEIYPLNREEQIPNFAVGTVIPYLGEFRNFVTLRGCMDAGITNVYAKMSKTHYPKKPNIFGSEKIVLSERQISTFGTNTGHKISGKALPRGLHNHRHIRPPFTDLEQHYGSSSGSGGGNPDYGDNTPGFRYKDWKTRGRIRGVTDYAGEHTDTYYANYNNDNPNPIELNPAFYSAKLILRVF